MINVQKALAAAATMPGDIVSLTKAQYAELLGELDAGQKAHLALVNLQSMTNVIVAGVRSAA